MRLLLLLFNSYSIFFHTNFIKKIPKQYHFLLTLFRYFMFIIPAYLLSFSCIPPQFQCLMRLHRRSIFPGRSGRRWMGWLCLFRSGCLGFWPETGLVRRMGLSLVMGSGLGFSLGFWSALWLGAALGYQRFLSTKHEGFGTGTSSVQSTAERYHGTAQFRCANGVFYASVLLYGDEKNEVYNHS